MLHTEGLAFSGDGLLHRNDVHADAGPSRRHELRRKLKRFLRRKIEHGGDFGIGLAQRFVFHHVFARADDPLRDPVLNMLVRIVAVLLQNADPDQMINDLLGFINAHIVAFGQFLRGQTEAALPKAQHELHFILGQQAVQDPEIHMVFLHAAGKFPGDVVRDQKCELFD